MAIFISFLLILLPGPPELYYGARELAVMDESLWHQSATHLGILSPFLVVRWS